MRRSDGTRLKNIPAFDRVIPHIMSRRYDATNYGKIEVDLSNLHRFLRQLRQEGHKVGIMDAVIAAYAMLLTKMPELNRFVAGKKIYQRNHVCVSFVILKHQEDGTPTETAVKVYIEPGDDLLIIAQKIRKIIADNETLQTQNALDRFVDRIMGLPLLPGTAVGAIKLLDRFGLLPKKIIALSPFHTSMFISNLASIQMNYVYHHLFEFGTTSLFVTLGMPQRRRGEDGTSKRVMTLGVSLDERICLGAIWAKGLYEFRRNLEHPQRLLNQPEEVEDTPVTEEI